MDGHELADRATNKTVKMPPELEKWPLKPEDLEKAIRFDWTDANKINQSLSWALSDAYLQARASPRHGRETRYRNGSASQLRDGAYKALRLSQWKA